MLPKGQPYPLTAIGLMTAGYPLSRARALPALSARYGWWLAAGFCFALSTLSLANGVKLAPVTYLVAVKRLSLLSSVALGGMWLRERPFLPRLLAAGPDVRRGGVDYAEGVSISHLAVMCWKMALKMIYFNFSNQLAEKELLYIHGHLK